MQAQLDAVKADTLNAKSAWENAIIQGAGVDVAQGHLDTAMLSFRAFVDSLRRNVDQLSANTTIIDDLSRMAGTLAEEKEMLKQVLAEGGSVSSQYDAINPKIRESPYINILGLQRNFRESTRIALIIASIIFGILTLCMIAYYIVTAISGGGFTMPIRIAGQG